MSETYTLSWSKSQGMLHLEPLSECLKTNRRAFESDRSLDYIVLHVGTEAECQQAAKRIRPIVIERDKNRFSKRRTEL